MCWHEPPTVAQDELLLASKWGFFLLLAACFWMYDWSGLMYQRLLAPTCFYVVLWACTCRFLPVSLLFNIDLLSSTLTRLHAVGQQHEQIILGTAFNSGKG
jgi:hypothetical protein